MLFHFLNGSKACLNSSGLLARQCLEEGLFYGDDLPEQDRRILEQYAATNVADAVDRQLRLRTRREFIDIIYRAVYKGRCHLVGYNLPYDLSRIAYDFKKARGRFAGGFSLGIWSYIVASRNGTASLIWDSRSSVCVVIEA